MISEITFYQILSQWCIICGLAILTLCSYHNKNWQEFCVNLSLTLLFVSSYWVKF